MIKTSVKKPFVVVVAVIVIMLIGAVALMRMETSLLPDMDLPYMVVVTTYPGASPEKVEENLTKPMESALGTVSGVESVLSTSAENYSMVMLEFADGTEMDSAMVKVRSAVNQIEGSLPEECGTPNILEISMDALAAMYVSVSLDGADIYEVSDFTEEIVVPYIERQSGVASVTSVGLVDQTIEVRLSEEKVDEINDRILAKVDEKFADAEQELADAEAQLADGEAALARSESQLYAREREYNAAISAMPPEMIEAAGLGSAGSQIASGKQQLASAKQELAAGKEELEAGKEQLAEAKEEAESQANIDGLLSLDTLSQIIYAQNFAMPAGYLDGEDDHQWLLKVGENYDSVEELKAMVLTNIDGIGDITLGDVADITIIDNSGDSYARVNGEQGILLSVFKGSTVGTSEVSDSVLKAIGELEAEYEGLHIVPLVDQGEYIDLVIHSIVISMLTGALLAVVILAIFLLDIRPTLVVAFSIPFSILTAIVFMYFTGVSINLMSLFGISLAVGMLVDNSIVVIENIYRLRYRGLSAPRAAVQGTRQVAGAIISSTLTTICVFFPIVFTTGLVRQLMLPFSLAIVYALVASLLVAMTLVPVMGSALLRNTTPRQHKIFDRIQEGYGKVLAFFLRVKIIPLGVALLLLIFCIYSVLRMGIVLLPDAGSDQITLSAEFDEEDTREECYEKADAIADAVLSVPGVAYIGVMDGGSASGITGAALSGEVMDYHSIMAYIIPEEGLTTTKELNSLVKGLRDATAGIDAEVEVTNSMMGEMDELLGSGLELDIFGSDYDTLIAISEDVMEIVDSVEGFTNITNGQEEPEKEIHLLIDKDAAIRIGLTEAQIYQAIAQRLTTEATPVALTVDGTEMDVTIVDELDTLTEENLLELEFETQTMDDTGNPVSETHRLSEVATIEYGETVNLIEREDGNRMLSVEAEVEDGYSLTLLNRQVSEKLGQYTMPSGYSYEFGGELENIYDMLRQMGLLMIVGAVLIYLVMVAQFQSLLSPFIVIFTVPLAFTGGLLGMLFTGTQMSLVSLMGFLVLMGTVVNNGIVFVDYVNQLRIGGLDKRNALIATGKTRMRPILMTALTTILAMLAMVFNPDAGAEMSKDMAIVVAAGLAYATLMTLFVEPVLYDIFYRKQPRVVDVGSDNIDDVPDDAAEFLAELADKNKE